MSVTRSIATCLLTIAVVFSASCYSQPTAEIARFLARQDFDAEVSHPSPTDWEKQTFNVVEKEQWISKSRSEVPDWKGAYYRFTIVKEVYHSSQEATSRIGRLREKPPGLAPEENKAFPLREGFAIENSAYILSCEVSMFHERLKEFTSALERELRQERASGERNTTRGAGSRVSASVP